MVHNHDVRVYLIRHGRTALNAENRLRGLADPELDDAGIGEAEATAQALGDAGIEHLVTSPLQRAQRTGEIIANSCHATWSTDDGFNDRDYGPWTGEPKDQVIAEWGSVDAAPGVESATIVRDRARRALDVLASEHDHGATIAVVTHDAVIRPLLESISPGSRPTVPTASWAVLDLVDGDWHVLSMDNTAETAAHQHVDGRN